MDPSELTVEDPGALIEWMGQQGKVSIAGGRELWISGAKMRSGWFVQWFRGEDGEQYSSGQDDTLIGALLKATNPP